MSDLDEQQYEKRQRAGLIPFIREGKKVHYLMMVASNPKHGGPRSMISKGKIEDDETALGCAVREAQEELGLVSMNMVTDPKFLTEERVVLRSGTYILTLYYVEVYNRWDFDKWCDETEYTEWHTLETFESEGRRDHVRFIRMLEQIVNP